LQAASKEKAWPESKLYKKGGYLTKERTGVKKINKGEKSPLGEK